MPEAGRTRKGALEKVHREGYEEWGGRERLDIDSKTLVRITMGGMMYVVHSLRYDRKQDVYHGPAEHFLKVGNDVEYQRRIPETRLGLYHFTEMLEGKLHYLRLNVEGEQTICVPPAQLIEVNRPIREE